MSKRVPSGEIRIPSDTQPIDQAELAERLAEMRTLPTPVPLAEETCVECPRCDGRGARVVVREENASQHREAFERDGCWLCLGLGVTPVTTMRRWVCAGRPDAQPDDWTFTDET